MTEEEAQTLERFKMEWSKYLDNRSQTDNMIKKWLMRILFRLFNTRHEHKQLEIMKYLYESLKKKGSNK